MGLVHHLYSIPCVGSYTGTMYTTGTLHLRIYPNAVSQRRIFIVLNDDDSKVIILYGR